MTNADAPTPRLVYLKAHINDAYEASVKVANEPDSHQIAFEASNLLNLLEFMVSHPDLNKAGDYSADFGEYTIDLLQKLIDRCSTETFTMHSQREHDIHNAVKIGEELHALGQALEQGRIAFMDHFYPYPKAMQLDHAARHQASLDFMATALFTEIKARRLELRQELLQNFGPM